MSVWPVYFADASADPDQGTCYVVPHAIPKIIERYGRRGQAWRMGHEYSSYVPSPKLIFKSTKRLGFTSESEFWWLMGVCRDRGLKPPTSYSDLFFQHYTVPVLPWKTFLAPFRGFTFGGWQEACVTGPTPGPVYHYDLNSAYRWAASTGLPDMLTARRSFRFDDPLGVYLVDLDANTLPYAKYAGRHMITSEERDYFRIRPRAVLHGIRFEALHDMVPIFAGLDTSWPVATVKKMARSFWGKFNAMLGPTQCTWKRGPRETVHKNHLYNPIWSAFITSRVKIRLHVFRPHAVHYFVDSILSTEEMPTGTGVGEFKLLGTYPGVFVKSAGWWCDGARPGKWIKHAGMRYDDACVN